MDSLLYRPKDWIETYLPTNQRYRKNYDNYRESKRFDLALSYLVLMIVQVFQNLSTCQAKARPIPNRYFC